MGDSKDWLGVLSGGISELFAKGGKLNPKKLNIVGEAGAEGIVKSGKGYEVFPLKGVKNMFKGIVEGKSGKRLAKKK